MVTRGCTVSVSDDASFAVKPAGRSLSLVCDLVRYAGAAPGTHIRNHGCMDCSHLSHFMAWSVYSVYVASVVEAACKDVPQVAIRAS